VHLTAASVRCAAVVPAASPAQMGRMQRKSRGAAAHLPPQGAGARSLPAPPRTASRRCNRGAARPAGQGASATAGRPRPGGLGRASGASGSAPGGRGDLCEASPAPGGRGREEWAASVTLGRAGWRHGGRADGGSPLGARSCRRGGGRASRLPGAEHPRAPGRWRPGKAGVRVGGRPSAVPVLRRGTGEPETAQGGWPVRRGTGRQGRHDLARGLPYLLRRSRFRRQVSASVRRLTLCC
jgi:hypothetical protein